MGRLGIIWTKASNHLQRALYLLGLVSFTLPFVTVKGCETEEITEYAGYELLGERGGWLYLIPIGLGLLFIALSFLRQYGNVVVRGFISSMRTLLAFAAGYVVGIFPYLQFFGDSVYEAVGQYVASASWALVYAASLVSTMISIKRTWPRRTAGAELKRGPIRLVFWLLVTLTLGLFGVSVVSSILNEDVVRSFTLFAVVFALSLYFALHFAESGLRERGRWAAAWVLIAAFLLIVAIVLVLLETEAMVFFVMPVTATAIGVTGLAVGYFADTSSAGAV